MNPDDVDCTLLDRNIRNIRWLMENRSFDVIKYKPRELFILLVPRGEPAAFIPEGAHHSSFKEKHFAPLLSSFTSLASFIALESFAMILAVLKLP